MGSDGASAADGAFLSPAEFAREAQLSMATVRRRLKDGGIPSIQPGGPGCRVLIPREALRFDFWQALGEEQKPYPPTPAELATSETQREEMPGIPGPTPRWRKPR